MFNSNRNLEQILFPAAVAVGALIVAGYLLLTAQLPPSKGVGFLAGLLGGFLSFAVGVTRRRRSSRHTLLRVVEVLFSPLAFVVILPFDVALAGGFFLGGVVSYCMAWAIGGISQGPMNAEAPDADEVHPRADRSSPS